MRAEAGTEGAGQPEQAPSWTPLAAVAVGALFTSTGPLLVKLSTASGAVFSFWRLWIGVPFLAVVAVASAWRQGRLRQIATGGWQAWRWAVWGGIAFGVHQVLFFTALLRTTVVDVMLVGTLQPLATAIAAAIVFSERPGRPFRYWTAVAMIGAATVILAGSSGPQGDPLGMLMAAGNVVFFVVFYVYAKAGRPYIDVLPFLCVSMTVAALAVSGLVLVLRDPVTAVTTADIGYAAILAIGPGFVGHFLTTWALQVIPANVPPLVRLSLPFLSGALAWLVLGETITTAHLVGGAITIGGVCGALLAPSGRAFSRGSLPPNPPVVEPPHRNQ